MAMYKRSTDLPLRELKRFNYDSNPTETPDIKMVARFICRRCVRGFAREDLDLRGFCGGCFKNSAMKAARHFESQENLTITLNHVSENKGGN